LTPHREHRYRNRARYREYFKYLQPLRSIQTRSIFNTGEARLSAFAELRSRSRRFAVEDCTLGAWVTSIIFDRWNDSLVQIPLCATSNSQLERSAFPFDN